MKARNVLIYAASETEADLLYPTGFFAPDPFLFVQKGIWIKVFYPAIALAAPLALTVAMRLTASERKTRATATGSASCARPAPRRSPRTAPSPCAR